MSDLTAGSRIDITGVSKRFESRDAGEFLAVDEADIHIEAGEFVSIVGPSGCGKSTLMLMAAGLLPVSSGRIEVDGNQVVSPLTDVGIAFQDHLLLDFRSAMDNVLLQADVRRIPRKELRPRAEAMFAQLGLGAAADKFPRQLSGGMRQRISLIRTLVHDPSILLFDEPFGALDALTRMQVRLDLEALWLRRRPTVLFITHSVEEAIGLSDRIYVMSPSPGRVVDEIVVDLPRPRRIVLGESPEFAAYAQRIYSRFEEMGVLHAEA